MEWTDKFVPVGSGPLAVLFVVFLAWALFSCWPWPWVICTKHNLLLILRMIFIWALAERRATSFYSLRLLNGSSLATPPGLEEYIPVQLQQQKGAKCNVMQ